MSLKKVTNLLFKAGKEINFLFDKSIEGFGETFKTGFVLMNNLVFDGSEKTFQIFAFLFIHRVAIAEVFYPTDELAKYVMENPDDLEKKFELYQQYKRKKDFYVKVSIGLSILPHKKHIMSKLLKKSDDELKTSKALEMFELHKMKEKIFTQFENITEEELLKKGNMLALLIKIKLELEEYEGLEEYLQVAYNSGVEEYYLLEGKYFRAKGKYQRALGSLNIATRNEVPYAKDELGSLLDEIANKEIDIDTQEVKEKYFNMYIEPETWEKLKDFPIAFAAVKINEFKNIKDSFTGDKNE